MSNFSLPDFFEILVRHDAFIAHCAGAAKGIGNESTNNLEYLERLKFAHDNPIELSCSTIKPGDECDWPFSASINYTGKVGLVLRPNLPTSITYAFPRDAGSQIDKTRPGRRYTGLPPATPQLVEEAILHRLPSAYNEIGVINYSVVGVFIDPPARYNNSAGEIAEAGIDELQSNFSGKQLFCLRKGKLFECVRETSAWAIGPHVSVSSLYSAIC